MSWSIAKKIGTPSKVRPVVEAEFDLAASYYLKRTDACALAEGADILATKATVLAWLDGVPADLAVIVEAAGSRGERWCSVKVDCTAVQLLV